MRKSCTIKVWPGQGLESRWSNRYEFHFAFIAIISDRWGQAPARPGVRVEDDPSGLTFSSVQPVQGPVLNPRINGLDAFSGSLTLPFSEAPVTLTWDPPALGSPTDYIVVLYQLIEGGGQVVQQPIRRFFTRKTSIAIPLGPQGFYYATITAQQADGGPNSDG